MKVIKFTLRLIKKYVNRQFLNIKFKKQGINLRRATINGDNFANLKLDNNIFIGDAFLDLHDSITIESNVGLGHSVKILTGTHNYRKIGQERSAVTSKPVVIKTGAWIASYVIVLPGTVVGEHAVVSAGSVVRGYIPPYTLVAGNPAVQITTIDAKSNA